MTRCDRLGAIEPPQLVVRQLPYRTGGFLIDRAGQQGLYYPLLPTRTHDKELYVNHR